MTRHRLQRHTVTINCTLRVHALNVTHFLHFVCGACTWTVFRVTYKYGLVYSKWKNQILNYHPLFLINKRSVLGIYSNDFLFLSWVFSNGRPPILEWSSTQTSNRVNPQIVSLFLLRCFPHYYFSFCPH